VYLSIGFPTSKRIIFDRKALIFAQLFSTIINVSLTIFKWVISIGSSLPTLYLKNIHASSLIFKIIFNPLADNKNRKEGRGSPGRSPLSRVNSLVGLSLTSTRSHTFHDPLSPQSREIHSSHYRFHTLLIHWIVNFFKINFKHQ